MSAQQASTGIAAALSSSEPSRVRDADEVFDSRVRPLVDGALPG